MTSTIKDSHQFGRTLKTLRTAANVSLREMARRINVTAGYLSQVESGRMGPPTDERIAQIAEVLGLPKEDMLRICGRLDPDITEYLTQRPECQELLKVTQELDLSPRQLGSLAQALRRGGAKLVQKILSEPSLNSPQPSIFQRFLSPELVFPRLEVDSRRQLFGQLLSAMQDHHGARSFHYEKALTLLEERERKASTSLGRGVALPHACPAGGPRPLMAVATLAKPLLFSEAKAKGTSQGPTHVDVVFLILGETRQGSQHLSCLSEIAQKIQNPAFLPSLLKAESATQLYESFL